MRCTPHAVRRWMRKSLTFMALSFLFRLQGLPFDDSLDFIGRVLAKRALRFFHAVAMRDQLPQKIGPALAGLLQVAESHAEVVARGVNTAEHDLIVLHDLCHECGGGKLECAGS